jgi:DNA replication protein DnaC
MHSKHNSTILHTIDMPQCSLCHGTGMQILEGGARRCKCRVQSAISRLNEGSNIPPLFETCSIESYRPEPNNMSQIRAQKYAQTLVSDYPAVDRGLMLMGPVGVGKTHLAVGIIKSLTEKGIPGMFHEFGLLLKKIQSTYNNSSEATESSIVDPLLSTEVLVLDELGAAKPTEWVRDIMMLIINTRYNEKRLTIVTTNYLDEPTNPREETLEDRIGVRLRSRLYGMCKTLHITGQDFRMKADKGIQV